MIEDFQPGCLKAEVQESNLVELFTHPKNTKSSRVQNIRGDCNNGGMIGLHGINQVGGILLKINKEGGQNYFLKFSSYQKLEILVFFNSFQNGVVDSYQGVGGGTGGGYYS